MLHELVAKDVLDELMEDKAVRRMPLMKQAAQMRKAVNGDDEQDKPRTPRALLLGSTALAGLGGYGLWGNVVLARHRLVDMLMHDKHLPGEFAGGRFADMVRRHKEDYIHFTDRASPLGEMPGDMLESWKLRVKLAEELAEGGISRLDALRQFRVARRADIAADAAMLGVAGFGWAHAIEKQRELAHAATPYEGR